jgi:hypothetical protein
MVPFVYQSVTQGSGLKSLSGKEFFRSGFRFTRVGRNRAECAWRVGKVQGEDWLTDLDDVS